MKIEILIVTLAIVGISCTNKKKPVVTIEGEEIFIEEIDFAIEPRLYYYLSRMYEERFMAINKIIEHKILSSEASKRKMSYEKFIDSLYANELYQNTNSVNINGLNYSVDSTEYTVSLEQGKEYIRKKVENELRKRWVDSLKSSYGVKILLSKPERMILIDMNDVYSYYRKDKNHPLTVWVISDYDCSVCKEMEPLFDSIYSNYNQKVNFAFTFFSGNISHASIAAECAAKQGKYWEMHHLLYETTDTDPTKYIKYAEEIGLDTIEFKKDFNNPALFRKIKNNIQTLDEKGVFCTPTIVIGKRMYTNIYEKEELSRLIEKALKKI